MLGSGVGITHIPVLQRSDPSAAYALYLPFKNGTTYRSGSSTSGSVTGLTGYSYTRSGAKQELAATSGLVSFAANTPGIVPGVGYWSRVSLTNLVLQSQAYGDASWTKSALNTSSNTAATTAPDGTLSADKLSPTAAVADHYVLQTAAVVAASTYTHSFFAKAAEFGFVTFRSDAEAGTWKNTCFNLSDGTIAYKGHSGSAAITSVGDGWYRCSVTVVESDTTGYHVLLPSSAAILDDVSHTRAESGAGGIYTWQSQCVLGTQPGPIIVTAGAAATLGADDLKAGAVTLADEDFFIWGVMDQTHAITGFLFTLHVDASNYISMRRQAGGIVDVYFGIGGVETTVNVASTASLSRAVCGIRRSGGARTAFMYLDGTLYTGASSAAGLASPTGAASVWAGQARVAGLNMNAPIEGLYMRRGTFTNAEVSAIMAGA